MGWQEAEIIKKWKEWMWFFFFWVLKVSTFPLLSQSQWKHSILQETFMRNRKKKFCERIEIFHLENQVFFLKRWEMLVLTLLFWSICYSFVYSFGSGCIFLNVVCTVYITYVNQVLYYDIARNEKHTDVNVFTTAKQELTQNNEISSDDKICDISQVVAKKSFSCKKKNLPAAYQLEVTTKIVEKDYSQ